MFAGMRPRAVLNLIVLNIQSILSTLADNIYSNWIPLFLAEVHLVSKQQMGLYSALPLLGGAIAGFVGGLLNDWLIAKTGNRRWSRSGIAFVGKGLGGRAAGRRAAIGTTARWPSAECCSPSSSSATGA